MMKKRLSGLFVCVILLIIGMVWMPIAAVSAAENYETLRAAIAAANAGGARTITLTEDIRLSGLLPTITGSVTIEGGGHSVSGAGSYRIFDVAGGALTLRDITLKEGRAVGGSGGALRLRDGAEVTIEGSRFSDNQAINGGAIATASVSDRLSVSGSSFKDNIAEQSAGAILARGARISISSSNFENNCALVGTYSLVRGGEASGNRDVRSVDRRGCVRVSFYRTEIDSDAQTDVEGGAIRLVGGARVSVEDSVFSDNRATYGGAIANTSSDVRLTVNRSSFNDNFAKGDGGAFAASWVGGGSAVITNSSFFGNAAENHGGGAIDADNMRLEIANSTFGENRAEYGGGALKVGETADVTVTHATFVENWSRDPGEAIEQSGGRFHLRNSIIVSSGKAEDCVGSAEQIGNLSVDGTCGDRPSDDPRLDGVTGSPAYYPLRDHSPAVDTANPAYCLETDQNGTARPQGGGCDIGAIESRSALAAEPTPVPPLVCDLANQIVAANRDWPAGGCPAGNLVDVISLNRDITLFAALPAITSHIVIEGNGHTISGDGGHRIFDVDGGVLTIRNLTMTEGRTYSNGGAIRLQNGGRAFVSDSRFYKNEADIGGAISIGYEGTENSSLSIERTSFVENRAWSHSGGINAGGGSISISNSSFVDNWLAAVAVTNFMRLDVVNTSFIGNGSTLIADNGVNATLTHVTACCHSSLIRLPRDRFLSPSRLRLRNSIISVNGLSEYCEDVKENINNLIEDGSCSPKYSGDPMLESGADMKEYLAPLPGSPAINAADQRFCPETDQLGRARPLTGRCDLGAIQAEPVAGALSNCRVTTTHLLNLRDAPNGKVIGGVSQNTALTATARTARWFIVEQDGASGWISADYVVTAGDCS